MGIEIMRPIVAMADGYQRQGDMSSLPGRKVQGVPPPPLPAMDVGPFLQQELDHGFTAIPGAGRLSVSQSVSQ